MLRLNSLKVISKLVQKIQVKLAFLWKNIFCILYV